MKKEEVFDNVQGHILLNAWRGCFWDGYMKAHASNCEIPDCEMCYLLKKGFELVPERS